MDQNYSSLQPYSIKLKQLIKFQTSKLYKNLQNCLDLSQKIQNTYSVKPIYSSKLHKTLKQHLQKLALQQSQYNQSLQYLTQQLISFQISKIQSQQMFSILRKYEQSLVSQRNQLVDKQNQVYYRIKDIYECYQDQYHNCKPKPQRIINVQMENRRRRQIQKECLKLSSQINQLMKQIEQQNGRKQRIQIPQEKDSKNRQQILQVDQQDYQMQINDVENKQNIKAQAIKNSINKNKNISPLNIIQLNKMQLQLQQSTTVQFKKSSAYQQNNVPYQSVGMNKRIPNFSQMPKRDYQMFRIYHNKIIRQDQRYQKLLLEYNNYLDVYKLVKEENKTIINNLKEQNITNQKVVQSDKQEQNTFSKKCCYRKDMQKQTKSDDFAILSSKQKYNLQKNICLQQIGNQLDKQIGCYQNTEDNGREFYNQQILGQIQDQI